MRLLTLERPFPAGGRFPSDPYVGPNVCAECHPGESAPLHAIGAFADLTLGRKAVAARQPDGTSVADPEHDDVLWGYRYRDGQLHISRAAEGRVEEFIAEYAFGSGQHATTFDRGDQSRNPQDPRASADLLRHGTRARVDPRPRLPGSPAWRDATWGRASGRRRAEMLRVHTTQTSARADRAIDEETMIPDVSCERRHGPGRTHVEAARRGAPDAQLELPLGPGRSSAEDLLKSCGTCHRHPSRLDSGPIRPEDPRLDRFQPVGLLQSRCFRESGGQLSCVTCHDPHARASADRAFYLTVCQSCHAGPGGGPAPNIPTGAS